MFLFLEPGGRPRPLLPVDELVFILKLAGGSRETLVTNFAASMSFGTLNRLSAAKLGPFARGITSFGSIEFTGLTGEVLPISVRDGVLDIRGEVFYVRSFIWLSLALRRVFNMGRSSKLFSPV